MDDLAVRFSIQGVGPGMETSKLLSAKTGKGVDEFLHVLERRRASSHAAAAVAK